jgi:hypothetical protein
MRGGRVADAERAYREAIAAGHVAVWVYLGVLLNALPGREDDAKAALRAALDDEDPALSSHAAVSLGGMLDKLDDDRATARARSPGTSPSSRGAMSCGTPTSPATAGEASQPASSAS